MRDLISRQAAIDALAEMYCKSDEDGYVWIIRIDACKRIDALPSVDAVEVVRCKDCRWHEREQPGMVYCPNTVGNWVEDDWYCKGGERRRG